MEQTLDSVIVGGVLQEYRQLGLSQTFINTVNGKAPTNNPTFTGTVSGITKSMVGLSNVDNTSDLNKPISTAVQTALNLKVSEFHVAFRAFGTGSVMRSYGKNNITTSNVDTSGGTGTYKVTMPAHPQGANYGVLASATNGSAT